MGDLVQNEVEGKLVYQIVEALVRCGIAERQIGIMSLYRQQIKLLSHLLQDKRQIEILTADKSQGRDKDCVVISMVRSNDHGQVRVRRGPMCACVPHLCGPGGRFTQGLATRQRVVYARAVQTRDRGVAADARCDGVDGRVFGVDGRPGVVVDVGGGCGEDAPDVGAATDGGEGCEARGW